MRLSRRLCLPERPAILCRVTLALFYYYLTIAAIYLACCQADQTTTPAGLKQIGDATGDCSLTTIPFVCTSTSPGSTRLSFDGTCTEPKLPVFAHGSFEQGLQANITCSSPTGQITVTNVSRSNCSDATGMNTDCFHTEFEISLNQSNSCRPVVCETIFNDTTTIAQGTITVSNGKHISVYYSYTLYTILTYQSCSCSTILTYQYVHVHLKCVCS